MTENQLRVLRKVIGGKSTFRCAGISPDHLGEFEAVADELLRLEAMGYLEGCEALPETETGRHHVGRVHVRGGIIDAGRETLKNHL
jgi:hypothetical protein